MPKHSPYHYLHLLLAVSLLASPTHAEVPQPVLDAEAARIAVIDRVRPAVLSVFSSTGGGGGSGVIISADGFALTNFHVAKPCGNAMKCGTSDGRLYDAVIVGLDPTGDVALIQLFGRDTFPHVELGDSDRVEVGDWALVMGNPFLLAADFRPTVTHGIISGVHRYQYPAGTLLEYADCLQTDASINPGNSGGPLFDGAGRLIGINGRGSFEKRGRVNVGVGYAISINQIKNFLGYLHSGRIVDHATLGATVASDDAGRVTVADILESSDAYRRGLRLDDRILSLAGRPVTTVNAMKNILGTLPSNWRVPLTFQRERERFDIFVRLEGLHTRAELIEKSQGRAKSPMPIPEGPPKEDDKDEDTPDPNRRIKLPHPLPDPERLQRMLKAKAPMPAVVADHFEARHGYANYFYNDRHRRRVREAWTASGKLHDRTGTWTLEGPLDAGRFRIVLDKTGARLELPDRQIPWQASDVLAEPLLPLGSGGMLNTLYLWRRLAVDGLDGFGEVHYQGTAPLPGRATLADVLVGVDRGVECRFYFDPVTGDAWTIEMFPAEDVDPCDLTMDDYADFQGHRLPGRITVRHGDDPYTVLRLDRYTLGATEGAP